MKSLNILILLNRVPFPLNDGGAIGTYQFVKGYAEAGCKVTCLAFNTSKHLVEKETIQKEFSFAQFHTQFLDNKIKIIPAFLNLFTSHSYIIQRFYSKGFSEKLAQILDTQTFDVVHLDGLPTGLYLDLIRSKSDAKIIQRAHNVEFKIWERAAKEASSFFKKKYLEIQSYRLKIFEKKLMEKVDCVLSISQEDDDFIHQLNQAIRTHIVPAGLDIPDSVPPSVVNKNLQLCFIGSFDWLPNLQGIDWFLQNIWDEIHTTFPTLEFHIAGKKMPASFHHLGKNIIAHGEVASANDFILAHDLMLVPLVSGSGVRIKIIEAFALGKAVIATSVAAEGSFATNGKEILIANTAKEFIEAIQICLLDYNTPNKIGSAAFEFVKTKFCNETNMKDLVLFLQNELQKKSRP